MMKLVMRQEVQHKEDTARLEALDEPLGCQGRVVKVMESKANSGKIKSEKLRPG